MKCFKCGKIEHIRRDYKTRGSLRAAVLDRFDNGSSTVYIVQEIISSLETEKESQTLTNETFCVAETDAYTRLCAEDERGCQYSEEIKNDLEEINATNQIKTLFIDRDHDE